jgi:hypothetical protein
MHIPGHLAVAALQHHLLAQSSQQSGAGWLFTAALFPDVVDKTIGYIFHAMPNGRHFTHNIFSLIGLSALVGAVGGKAAGRAWLVGHLGHLLADSGSMMPWFFPLKRYPFKPGSVKFESNQLIKESGFLLLVLLFIRLNRPKHCH